MTGRPSTFTAETANRICSELADGNSLMTICAATDMPSRETVYKWLGKRERFADDYARARDKQADHFAAEIIDIADTEKDSAKARNRIDARKWYAGKVRPRSYGDKQQIEHDVSGGLADVLKAIDGNTRGKPGA